MRLTMVDLAGGIKSLCLMNEPAEHWAKRSASKIGIAGGTVFLTLPVALVAIWQLVVVPIQDDLQEMKRDHDIEVDRLEAKAENDLKAAISLVRSDIDQNERELTEAMKTLAYYQGMIDSGGNQ